MRDEDRHPVENCKRRDETDEVAEHHFGGLRGIEEAQRHENGRCGDAPDRGAVR